jgi:hypothetical protein
MSSSLPTALLELEQVDHAISGLRHRSAAMRQR